MNLKEKFKVSFITKSIDKTKKKNPFNVSYSELYQLPQDADYSMNNSYYFSGHDQEGKTEMSIIIQKMIKAQKAGVCFTQDHIAGGNYMLIEAVQERSLYL